MKQDRLLTPSSPSGSYASRFSVIYGPHAGTEELLRICVCLALQGPVQVLDFGNRSNMYFAARELRSLTNDPAAAMKNILIRRAFTAYQAATVLEQQCAVPDRPVLIFDLLSLLLDENIQIAEADRLFADLLCCIRSISSNRFVAAGIKPFPGCMENRKHLLARVYEAADEFCQTAEMLSRGMAITAAKPQQLPLFE